MIYSVAPLLLGWSIDALIGDPYSLPHPIRLFGNLIAFGEKILNRGSHRRLKGTLLSLFLVGLVIGVFWLATYLLSPYPLFKGIFEAIFIFYGLSARQLVKEALAVEHFVQTDDLTGARHRVGYIVGRDTSNLSFNQIRTATLETLAENLSDGIVAPLFFYAIGGVPLMMGYKMINTLDSMIGYKNERYGEFGYFAAKILDDWANYLPARITAILIWMLHPTRQVWHHIRRYARAHSSPNSGYPESAMAGLLGCRFGGPNVYHGKLVEKPYIGEIERDITHADLIRGCRVVSVVTLLSVGIVCGILLLL